MDERQRAELGEEEQPLVLDYAPKEPRKPLTERHLEMVAGIVGMVVICFFLALVLVGVIIPGCDNKDRTVHFIVPDNYTGYFWIITDPADGIDARPNESVVTLRIPENGILRVKDTRFFEQWHKVKASYYSGARLKAATDDDLTSSDIAVFGLGGTTNETMARATYVVGSREAVRDYYHGDQRMADQELWRRLEVR